MNSLLLFANSISSQSFSLFVFFLKEWFRNADSFSVFTHLKLFALTREKELANEAQSDSGFAICCLTVQLY